MPDEDHEPHGLRLMERLDYFLRRVLLMVPTFVGITRVCFALCQVVPGGPVEQALAKMRGMGAAEAGQSLHAGVGNHSCKRVQSGSY